MNDWQEIKSAPKDGSIIWGYGTALGDPGYTSDEKKIYQISWLNNRWVVMQATPRHFNGFILTHWMKIPELPKEVGDGTI